MEQVSKELLQQSLDALSICRQTLEQVTTSCCDSTRSPRMIKAFGFIDNVLDGLKSGVISHEKLEVCINDIRQLGGVIGDLHVSCCTDIREPLFQQIFKQLNMTHSNLMSAMGFSH